MLSILFGLIAVLAGLYGMRIWFPDLIHFFKGLLPVSLFFAGIVAIIAGMSGSAKPPTGSKKA
jgi:hypothetical protein